MYNNSGVLNELVDFAVLNVSGQAETSVAYINYTQLKVIT